MRRWLLLFLTTCFLVACSNPTDAVFVDSAGDKHRLSDYQGKWVVINYWARWCRPCLKEIPELNAFAKRYRDKAVVLGVSYDSLSAAELLQAVKQFKFHYPILERDPAQQLKLGKISVVPMTVLINPKGKVIEPLYGPQTSATLARVMQLNR